MTDPRGKKIKIKTEKCFQAAVSSEISSVKQALFFLLRINDGLTRCLATRMRNRVFENQS